MKVIELVLEKSAYGWSPEELHFQHPYLSLGQIHSALAYYWDHQKELDSDIENRLATVEQTRQKMRDTLGTSIKLRSMNKNLAANKAQI